MTFDSLLDAGQNCGLESIAVSDCNFADAHRATLDGEYRPVTTRAKRAPVGTLTTLFAS